MKKVLTFNHSDPDLLDTFSNSVTVVEAGDKKRFRDKSGEKKNARKTINEFYTSQQAYHG